MTSIHRSSLMQYASQPYRSAVAFSAKHKSLEEGIFHNQEKPSKLAPLINLLAITLCSAIIPDFIENQQLLDAPARFYTGYTELASYLKPETDEPTNPLVVEKIGSLFVNSVATLGYAYTILKLAKRCFRSLSQKYRKT